MKIRIFIAFFIFLVLPASQINASAGHKLTAQTTAWVNDQLGTDGTPRSIVPVPPHELTYPGGAQVPCENTRIIQADPNAIRAWHRMAYSRLLEDSAAHLFLHEILHMRVKGKCPVLEIDFRIEEWITEAVTLDLLPAWSYRFTHYEISRPHPMWVYRQGVRYIRAASTIATHSRNYRTRNARLWRRQLYLASPTQRRIILATLTKG